MRILRSAIGFAVSIALLSVAINGCKKPQKNDDSARLKVVCTFLPIYVMTQNVTAGIPGVEVKTLLPPEVGCPHEYSLTPRDALMLETAHVLVMNGLGMEQFLADSPFLERDDLKIIIAAASVDPLEIDPELSHRGHEGAGHDHELNPHAWVSPVAAIQMVREIAGKLSEIDSVNSQKYTENADGYIAKLDSLSRAFDRNLSRVNNKRIVTQHAAFDYLARDFGLEIVGVIATAFGIEPSAKEVHDLIDTINQTKPAGIFVEPQYHDQLAKTISAETGIRIYTLDPAVSGDDGPDSYLQAMRKNLETLQSATDLLDIIFEDE